MNEVNYVEEYRSEGSWQGAHLKRADMVDFGGRKVGPKDFANFRYEVCPSVAFKVGTFR